MAQCKLLINDKHASSISKAERAEVDTTLPFESVRAAMSLFGGQAEMKIPVSISCQKQLNADLRSTKGELESTLNKTATAEKKKEKAVQEVREARRWLDIVTNCQEGKATTREGLMDSSRPRRNGLNTTNSYNKYAIWETKLRATEERHTLAAMEMQTAMQELTDLKQDLLASLTSKKDAVFGKTDAALEAVKEKVKTGEEITAELSGLNNWLSLLKIASTDASKEKPAGLKAASEGFQIAKDFELKLVAMMNESLRVRGEMKSMKAKETKLVEIALEAVTSLEDVDAILRGTSMVSKATVIDAASKGKDNIASLSSLLESVHMVSKTLKQGVLDLKEREAKAISVAEASASELTKVQFELGVKVAAIEAEALKSTLSLSQALKKAEAEAEAAREETKYMHKEASKYKCEAEARAKDTEELQIEADQAKEELEALRKFEMEAAQAKEQLKALRKFEAEAAQAREELEILRKVEVEAAQAKKELEALRKCKAETVQVQEELQAPKEFEAEAIKAPEELKTSRNVEVEAAQAMDDLKKLRKVEAEAPAAKEELEALRKVEAECAKAKEELEALSKVKAEAVKAEEELQALGLVTLNDMVKISQDEYQSLKLKAQKNEGFESTRSVAALSQAEAVKEMLIQNILSADDETGSIKRALTQALHRAEMAEKARYMMEEELRGLREREQRRREKAMAFVASQQQLQEKLLDEQSTSFRNAKKSETLGRVLNINISAHRTKTLVRISSRKQRKPALPSTDLLKPI